MMVTEGLAFEPWRGQCHLYFQSFDDLEHYCRQQQAEHRCNPVQPMVSGERVVDNGGTQGPGWVERAAGERQCYQLCDEKREADADRCDEL